MEHIIDQTDRQILELLQADASQSVEAIAQKVHLARNTCWRRIKQLEDSGVLRARVGLVDAGKVGLGLSVFVMVRAREHSSEWLERFKAAVSAMPEVTGAFRMSGELDYLLRVRVPDVPKYDAFYKRLIERVPLADVSASFVMEDIKDTHRLPV